MGQGPLQQKYERLQDMLSSCGSLLVAFSGGVDSTFLLAAAHDALGEKACAATVRAPVFTDRELREADRFCRERRIRHIHLEMDPWALEDFTRNPPDRCYHCKKAMCELLLNAAREHRVKHIAHGANVDDLGDHRPGLRAAREAGVLSPLVDAELTKAEIRRLSKNMGLAAWDLPSRACLASRVPYGSPVTPAKLRMVEEAEDFLMNAGFSRVRVRHHGEIARIEVPTGDFPRLLEEGFRKILVARLLKTGFRHVAMDLEGLVSGSLNRVFSKAEVPSSGGKE